MRGPQLIFCLFASWAVFISSSAKAQITPDATLGSEPSVVTPNIPVRGNLADLVEGGATRGTNLFHSFSDFNVGESQRLYFASPAGIESILSRVTGSNSSNILGRLGVAGPADLYLINPNGFVFGKAASLDVAGSLVVTTAEAIALGEGIFSATAAQSNQLLAVSPSVSLFNYLTENSQDITSLGTLDPGKNLTLEANNIEIEGTLRPGRDLFLASANTVQLRGTAERTQTGAFTNIQNGSAGIGGNIQITAANLNILDGAQIDSGTAGQGNAGNISLNIQDTIRLTGKHPTTRASRVSSSVEMGGEGQGGTLTIRARNLEAVDGAQIRSVVAGRGNAGDVTIEVREKALFSGDVLAADELAGVIGNVAATGEGQGGNIMLKVGDLFLLEGAQISTDLLGQGNSGDVTVSARGNIQFIGSDNAAERTGGAFSRVTTEGAGQGGNIRISANNIDVLNGAQVSSELLGAGNAGDVLLNIRGNARFAGSNSVFTSGAFSLVGDRAEGQAGNVQITAKNISLLEGAQISASTAGKGNAGNIILQIGETARFAGRSAINGEAGGAFSLVQAAGEGQSGDIRIAATNLEVVDGAQLSATLIGRGNAGNINLNIAETVLLEGGQATSENNSGIFSSVAASGQGQSGNIDLRATRLSVLSSAQISTAVLGQGNAGNVILNVAETASFVGNRQSGESAQASGVFSNVADSGAGQSGNINVAAKRLEVLGGAQLTAAVAGQGNAGNVILNVRENARFDGSGSGVFSSIDATGQGQGGNVVLTAGDVAVTNGAVLSTELAGRGNAGSVSLGVRETVRLEGSGSAASSRVSASAEGGGGDVLLSARNLLIQNNAEIVANNEGRGNAGNIGLTVRDRLDAKDGTIRTNANLGAGGRIQINSRLVVLQGDSDVQTFVSNSGNSGGNIAITANAIVVLGDSDILAFSPEGQGGAIDLSQATLFSQNLKPISDKRLRADLLALDGNAQADISAAGGTQSGQISINNANFVENDLAELPNNLVDTEVLLANSCIARSADGSGTLVVAGRDRLPQTPQDPLPNSYSAGTVEPIPTELALVEPQLAHRLPDGRLLISRRCGE